MVICMEPGALLRAAREAAGISLRAMAERTYYGKTYLSLIETGQRPVPAGVAAAYERVLGADLERLTAVARTPASVDTAALSDVAVMLAATRRIEDVAGAVAVLPAARGMSAMTETFAREARTAPTEAASLASEVTQYRGWLEHAIGADAAARRSLGTAVSLAKEARDPDRLAHSLGFLGYVTVSAGNYGEVIARSDAALAVRDAHPTIRAYGRMRRAELLAAHGRRAKHNARWLWPTRRRKRRTASNLPRRCIGGAPDSGPCSVAAFWRCWGTRPKQSRKRHTGWPRCRTSTAGLNGWHRRCAASTRT